jgi:hypothetical protein
MRQTVAVGVIKAVEKTDGKAGKVTKAAEKGTLDLPPRRSIWYWVSSSSSLHRLRRLRPSPFRTSTFFDFEELVLTFFFALYSRQEEVNYARRCVVVCQSRLFIFASTPLSGYQCSAEPLLPPAFYSLSPQPCNVVCLGCFVLATFPFLSSPLSCPPREPERRGGLRPPSLSPFSRFVSSASTSSSSTLPSPLR